MDDGDVKNEYSTRKKSFFEIDDIKDSAYTTRASTSLQHISFSKKTINN